MNFSWVEKFHGNLVPRQYLLPGNETSPASSLIPRPEWFEYETNVLTVMCHESNYETNVLTVMCHESN